MSSPIKTKLIRIGNAQGVRIPKTLIEQVGLAGEVELEAQADGLIIRPIRRRPREGWAEQFRAMAERGDDRLIDGDWPPTSWEQGEWQW